MKKTTLTILTMLIALAMPMLARQYAVKDVPNVQLADSTQMLCNPDSIVGDSAAREINRLLRDIRSRTSAEVAVVVLSDIAGEDVDEFATQLFKAWSLGKKGQDNGVLLLVARDSRRMTLRTGYGVEGLLPDIVCGHVLDRFVVPRFKEGLYGQGILDGVAEIHRLLTDPAAAEELQARLKTQSDGDGWMYALGFFGIIGLIIAALMKLSKKGGSGDGDGNGTDDGDGNGTDDGDSTPKPRTTPRMTTPRSHSRSSISSGSIGGSWGGGSTGGGGASRGW